MAVADQWRTGGVPVKAFNSLRKPVVFDLTG